MKIFRCDQIRQIDEFTIKNEPIASADLMERAAGKVFAWFSERFDTAIPVVVFAGPGNNGGDGLALARMLSGAGHNVSVYFAGDPENTSSDWKHNLHRLQKETHVPFSILREPGHFPEIRKESVIVDSLFGSGLSRPLTGISADIVQKINKSGCTIISIDIPSGLFCEDNSLNKDENIIRADFTLTFQFPKLSFMFPENEKYTGLWFILPIGLHNEFIRITPAIHDLIDRDVVKPLLKLRNRFDHKGNFGHVLLVGGSHGRMGAMVLAAKAALRSGAGLVTCRIPSSGNFILQAAVPEAMTSIDRAEKNISDLPDPGIYSAAGIGPGMGTLGESGRALYEFLVRCRKPVVLDADALNILSENKEWYNIIPPMAVLTPHPKEFERLAGKTINGFERLQKQVEFSVKHKCIIILKGAHTSISDPLGAVRFNSTGNPGMATAGSGDALTGVITSLLAQGYDPLDASVTGVYLHGLAGDIAAERSSQESLIASDLIENIGEAFRRTREQSRINDDEPRYL